MCSEKNGIFSLQKENGSHKILQNLQLCFALQADSETKGIEFLYVIVFRKCGTRKNRLVRAITPPDNRNQADTTNNLTIGCMLKF